MGVGLATVGAIAFGFTYADQAALLPLLSSELGLSDLQVGLRICATEQGCQREEHESGASHGCDSIKKAAGGDAPSAAIK